MVALLVVDMQKEFFQEEKSRDSLNAALEYINYSINVFREAGKPVIFIQDKETSEEGYEVYQDLEVREDDLRVSKYYCNSFWKTDLEELLHKLEVELVVVCGFAAEYCVYATYHGAMERGFKATLLQHGIASRNKDHVDFIQNIGNTTSISTLKYFLNTNNEK